MSVPLGRCFRGGILATPEVEEEDDDEAAAAEAPPEADAGLLLAEAALDELEELLALLFRFPLDFLDPPLVCLEFPPEAPDWFCLAPCAMAAYGL